MEGNLTEPSATEPDDFAERAAKDREGRIQKYLGQFDRLILGLIGAALLLTVIYGLAAGPASPREGPASAAGERTAAGKAIAPRPTARPAAPAGDATGNSAIGQSPGNAARSQTAASRITTSFLALSIAMAAVAIGAFVGFLFGLPRTLTSGEARGEARSDAALAASQDGPEANATLTASRLGPSGPAPGVAVNTNLEQISDWLTKIIVGVGLTKLESVPGALDRFGSNVEQYFGYGGKVFGIGGGLFFLIAGFFLSYVGTRVKLSLVFVGSQRDNTRTADSGAKETAQTALSRETSAVDSSSLAMQPSDDLQKADLEMLKRSLADLKTPEERAAYANAAARQGKRELAVDIMTDLVKERPHDQKILSDYAGVLALLGDSRVDDVLSTIRTTTPAAEPEAQDKVNIAILRNGLYDGGFEASIDAGEALLQRPIAEHDPWIPVWLASAYGQKHRALKESGGSPKDISDARDRVVQEVERALSVQPGMKNLLATLYDPAKSNGVDEDLQSLFGDARLDELLGGQ
jgi:hypothetical protein